MSQRNVAAYTKTEQLITFLIFSHIAADLGEMEAAQAYMAQTLQLLKPLLRKPHYCASHISRFILFTVRIDDLEQPLALPFFRDMPSPDLLTLQELAMRKSLTPARFATLADCRLLYVRIAFNPQEMHTTLSHAQEMPDTQQMADSLAPLLQALFRENVDVSDPYTLAKDHFQLAEMLLLYTPSLAHQALEQADKVLTTIHCSAEGVRKISIMRESITTLQQYMQRKQARISS